MELGRARAEGEDWAAALGPVREGKEEEAGWAEGFGWARSPGVWAGFRVSVFFLLFYFLFQTKLNLFEFKFEFEFKPHSIK